MKYLAGIVLLLTLFACTPQRYLYYGDSSYSYYKAVKKADQRSVDNYKASLEKVFQKSSDLGLPVPPGLYCDYALLLLAEENRSGAKDFFLKEKAAWSESAVLVDFLLAHYELGN